MCSKQHKSKKKGDISEYFELNYSEAITYQSLWDTLKTVLRGKRIAFNAYIRKEEKSKNPSKLPPCCCLVAKSCPTLRPHGL